MHLVEVRLNRIVLGAHDGCAALRDGLVVYALEVALGDLLGSLLCLVRLRDLRRVEPPALAQPIGKVANHADKALDDKGNEEKREQAKDHGASPFGWAVTIRRHGRDRASS